MKNLIIEKHINKNNLDCSFLRIQRKGSVIFIIELIQISPLPQQSHYETNYKFDKLEINVKYSVDRLNKFFKKPCSNELLWFIVNAIGKYNEKE